MLIPTIPSPADPSVGPAVAEALEAVPRRSAKNAWYVLVAVSLLADFAMAPLAALLNGPPNAFAFAFLTAVGCTLAQGSLLAAWLVLWQGSFARRLVRHWTIAAGLWCVWFGGLALSTPPQDFFEVGFTVACTVPLVSLGAQLPLWIVRQLFGWRLVRPGELEGPAPSQTPLSIRDLMLATAVVAVSFAIARLGPAFQQEHDFWIAWCIGMAVAATTSVIAILPAAAMLLRPRPWRRALILTGGYLGLFVGGLWLVVATLWWNAPEWLLPYQIYVGLSLVMFSYAGTCVLAAYVARGRGYYLSWRRRSQSI